MMNPVVSSIKKSSPPPRKSYSPLQVDDDTGDDAGVASIFLAPFDLPGGYELQVELNGEYLRIEIPEEGVKAGQQFRPSAVVAISIAENKIVGQRASTASKFPVGAWRDGVFDCCLHGPCHPHLCCAMWCYPCALGHIMTRLGLGASARPVVGASEVGAISTSAFTVLLRATISVVLLQLSLLVAFFVAGGNLQGSEIIFYVLYKVLSLFWGLYLLWIGISTRKYIRKKYAIPASCCEEEDTCLMVFCSCCSLSQMYRHTADYTKDRAACFSETGLVEHSPATNSSMVV